jgi:hypothetical protein
VQQRYERNCLLLNCTKKGEPTSIKNGEPILIEMWFLYRLIGDCIKLSKLMALDNKPTFYRETHLVNGGEKVVVLQLSK